MKRQNDKNLKIKFKILQHIDEYKTLPKNKPYPNLSYYIKDLKKKNIIYNTSYGFYECNWNLWDKEYYKKQGIIDEIFDTKTNRVVVILNNEGYRKKLKYYNNKCYFCNNKDGVNKHHIIPKKYKGSDYEENIIGLCPNHHFLMHYKETYLEYKDQRYILVFNNSRRRIYPTKEQLKFPRRIPAKDIINKKIQIKLAK